MRAEVSARWTPERRAEASARVKEWWTPERRADFGARMKEWWTPEERAARGAKWRVFRANLSDAERKRRDAINTRALLGGAAGGSDIDRSYACNIPGCDARFITPMTLKSHQNRTDIHNCEEETVQGI